MLRGLYTSASNMMAQMTRQGITTNNINNVNTTGYKQDLATQGLFWRMMMTRVERADLPLGEMSAGATDLAAMTTTAGAVRTTTDFGQGSLIDTGGELDLSLSGPGFFVLQTPAGLRLTRDGSFGRDAEGRLTAADGALVLGENGPLTLPPGPVLVEGDGALIVNGQAVGRLRLAQLPADQLEKDSLNRYSPRGGAAPAPAPTAAVNQGFLEGANVDLTRATSDMMAASRSYEASQRLMQMQDELLGRAVNEVGRVG